MISVVIATHNEEKNLAQTLDSVRSWVDEIIIVDGESTDKTLEIAKAFKAIILKTTNKANFHINKQMGMDKAKGELVLQLDADEVVDQELQAFIVKLHQRVVQTSSLPATEPVAWYLMRKNYFLGRFLKKGGQYPDPVIRLYLAGKAHLPQKDVHEQMVVDGPVATAQGHLLHYSNPTFQDYLRKFDTYTSFKAHQLKAAHVSLTLGTTIRYVVIKPLTTVIALFVRHKGFVDGFAGLVFAVMSGLHHAVAYLKYWELTHQK